MIAAKRGKPVSRGGARLILFATLATLCIGLGGAYVVHAVLRPGSAGLLGPTGSGEAVFDIARDGQGKTLVVFENRASGPDRGQVAAWDVNSAEWLRTMLPLTCARVHYAGGRGLCLALDQDNPAAFAAYVFAPDTRIQRKLVLNGLPSRTRVSPDGRLGATTVFSSGQTYSDISFSTETNLIDLESGAVLANLESFTVSRDGAPFRSEDFNYWGVTFASDGQRIYATLATGSERYLVEGRIASREFKVLRGNVECPSLSPNGERIAFKKRMGGTLGAESWRFHVLDLATGTETPLAEERSIDDQIEWLDDKRVLYSDGVDIWVANADGSGGPEVYIGRAQSPAVVRPPVPSG